MVKVKPNLEREREGHDDICNHYILQVNDEVRLWGYSEKHPHSHAVQRQPQQEEEGVEDRENHRLQDVVTGTSAVGVVVMAGNQQGSHVSLHECHLEKTRESCTSQKTKNKNKNTQKQTKYC